MPSTSLYDNKYQYVKDLGSGGFGKVFLAKEKISHRLVAIKELLNKAKDEQDSIIREIQFVAKFNHPNIVTYLHHFYQDDLLYLVMEYCEGGSLWSNISNKKVNQHNAILWSTILAETFDFIHSKKVVHHDIKPGNILFTAEGTIKISDFGVANTSIGTRCYLAPEAFVWKKDITLDTRIDIYALGVTLMEMLIGKNPFNSLSNVQILALHHKGDFPIQNLPDWQQEIILKAINKVPELRFQTMINFAEALEAQKVPIIIDKDNVRVGDLAHRTEKLMDKKQWSKAASFISFAEKNYPLNVNMLKTAGRYNLLNQKIGKAKRYYEEALKFNPRLDVQKELGWINLEQENYPTAISLLSDHLHRNPSDYQTYNLLIQCFYETNRYDIAMDLARMMMDIAPDISCFANNYYVSNIMQNIGKTILPGTVMKAKENPFIDYNLSVILEEENKTSHSLRKSPTLKSKLLFQDFRFNNILKSTSSLIFYDSKNNITDEFTQKIITLGRKNYNYNDYTKIKGDSISRRHCLFINCKDDVWLYDLESHLGEEVNGIRVKKKVPLIGVNKITINDQEITINTDKRKLI